MSNFKNVVEKKFTILFYDQLPLVFVSFILYLYPFFFFLKVRLQILSN